MTDRLPALGIDHGDARIGVSATDPLGILCHPVETIVVAQTNPALRIAELVRQRGIRTLVIGLPIRLDGTEGTAAAKVKKFAQSVTESCPGIPMEFVDERLTTTAAHEKMQEAGRKAKDRKMTIDQAAAVEILNSWMEENGLFSNDF